MVSESRRNLVLTVVCLALVLVMAGVAMLNLALPSIARDLGASQSQQQWIIDGYTVVLAALLLPLGALGDRLGRRPMLLTGIAVFGLAAVPSAMVDTTGMLIALRALSGVGAAMIMPATLATITNVFPAEERAKAVGVWAGFAGIGAIIGLLVSGFLLEHFWWGSLFVVTAIAAVVAFVLSWLLVPDTKDPAHAHLDPPGSLLSIIGIGGLVLGIIEGPERGWTASLTVGGFVVGSAAIVAWVLWSLRADKPLLDFRLFALPGFSAGTMSLFAQFFALFGLFLIVMQFLLLILGYGTWTAAVSLAPMAAVILPVAVLAGLLAHRFGQRLLGMVGLSVCAAGFGVLATMSADSGYWHLFAGLIVVGVGMALAMTPATDAVVGSLPPAKQGVASAVNDAARELGAAFGIAVLGSAFNAGYRNDITRALAGLPPEAAKAAKESPAAAFGVAQQLGEPGTSLIAAVRDAFMTGTRYALVAGATMLVLGALIVAWRAPRHDQDPEVTLHDALGDALSGTEGVPADNAADPAVAH